MNVRITKTPPGRAQETVPGVPFVAQTMGASEKGTGTIEAEGGETIVGDVNRDGMLEHFSINGPSHTAGGVELDVDPGSFVFSNAKQLRIKDPDTLARFTKGVSKKGLTPAQIAKQYDINTHVNTLKDDTSSPIAKRTAQLMMDTNTQKLAELALLQESLKGFPNGVPAIAQQLLPPELTEQVAPQGTPQMRFGGELSRFVGGGEKTLLNQEYNGPGTPGSVQSMGQVGTPGAAPLPKAGQKIYLNGQPLAVSEVNINSLVGNPNARYIHMADGSAFTKAEWTRLHSGKPITTQGGVGIEDQLPAGGLGFFKSTGAHLAPKVYSTTPQLPARKFGNGATSITLQKGDYLKMGNVDYEVLNPHGEYTDEYQNSGKSWRDAFDDTHGTVMVKNRKTGEIEFKEGEDITDSKKNAPEYFALNSVAQRNAARDAKLKARNSVADLYAPEDIAEAKRYSDWQKAQDLYGPDATITRPAPTKAPPSVVKTQPAQPRPRSLVQAPAQQRHTAVAVATGEDEEASLWK